ncbi:hypothetical protein F5146DRAFT_1051137 [Armillaria mellea]|nr:hypothetical protein F5146DRAFT_1051137 [Armillaria mellea]
MSEIPPEIFEQIVDELVDDRESLVACLSVSTAFHSRARYHLFQTVQLETNSDFHQFISLCDISPVILGLVQSLKVFSSVHPVPHLPHLPNVTSLQIGGHLHDEWQTNFPSTICLTLKDLVFPTAHELPLTSMGSYALARGPPLEFLSIGYVSSSLYDVFLGSTTKAISRFALHGIRKIRHTTVFPYDAAGIHEVLAVTRGTLQELDMKVQLSGPQHWFDEIVDISQVPTVNFRVATVKVPEPLDAILTDSRYCVLKVVQFNLREKERHLSREKCQVIREAILMALPKLQALGRLVVEDEII